MKLPPYGKHVIASPQYALECPLYIFTGGLSWENGKNHFIDNPYNTLVLPSENLPREYYWPVQNRNIVITDSYPSKNWKETIINDSYIKNRQDYLDELVYFLYKYKVKGVVLLLANEKLMFIHKDI